MHCKSLCGDKAVKQVVCSLASFSVKIKFIDFLSAYK